MRDRRLGVGVIAAAAVFSLAAGPAYAGGDGGPLRKLGRGAANVATGWLEMGVQVFQSTERQGTIAGASVGLVRGIALGLGRTIVGAFEIATFPFPNPSVGYRPLIEPEFVTFRDADR